MCFEKQCKTVFDAFAQIFGWHSVAECARFAFSHSQRLSHANLNLLTFIRLHTHAIPLALRFHHSFRVYRFIFVYFVAVLSTCIRLSTDECCTLNIIPQKRVILFFECIRSDRTDRKPPMTAIVVQTEREKKEMKLPQILWLILNGQRGRQREDTILLQSYIRNKNLLLHSLSVFVGHLTDLTIMLH